MHIYNLKTLNEYLILILQEIFTKIYFLFYTQTNKLSPTINLLISNYATVLITILRTYNNNYF